MKQAVPLGSQQQAVHLQSSNNQTGRESGSTKALAGLSDSQAGSFRRTRRWLQPASSTASPGCWARMDIASSDANVLWPNVVETDGAQSSALNDTVDGEVENRLWSVSDHIKTLGGSNVSGRVL